MRVHHLAATIVLAALAAASRAHEGESELPFDRPHAHDEMEGHFHFGWESRYTSEGRDNWGGDALLASSFELGWRHFSGGVWYGRSPEGHDDELQIALAVTESAGDFEGYAGITHLRYPVAGTGHYSEIGAGFTWAGLPLGIVAGVDAYYSLDSGGAFWEAALSREFAVSDTVTIESGLIFGANQGYVPDGHDGANHVSIRLGGSLALSARLSLVAHVSQSWALGRDSALAGDASLTDFFHGGAGLQWAF